MKTTKTHGILLGLGVLGIGTLLGVGSTPNANAAPGVTRKTVVRTTRTVQVQPVQYRRPVRRPVRPNRPYRPVRPVRPSQVNQTFNGRVTNDLKGNDFIMRADNGRTIRVLALRGEPGGLDRNDRVQVFGYFNANGVLQASRVTVLRNR